jgi:hypothetical protein
MGGVTHAGERGAGGRLNGHDAAGLGRLLAELLADEGEAEPAEVGATSRAADQNVGVVPGLGVRGRSFEKRRRGREREKEGQEERKRGREEEGKRGRGEEKVLSRPNGGERGECEEGAREQE